MHGEDAAGEVFSVIIPVLNEEERIGELVRYLFANGSGRRLEVIVSDGGSLDGTCAAARRAGARVVECRERGRARQMNRGAEAAAGSILYFLHADTVPPADYAERIRTSITQGVEAGCFRLRFDDSHPLLQFYGWFTRLDFDLFRFGDQSLFLTSELFCKIGGFRDDLLVMEDQEIVRRIKKNGRFRVLKASVVTSARKYRKYGLIRLQLIFGLILLLYYAGIKQKTLQRLLHSLTRPP